MMSKSKVPQIRFKGFGEAWDENELGNKVEFFSGLTYSPNDIVKEDGTLVLRSSNVKDGRIVNADNVYVNSDVVNCNNVLKGDIAVVVRNGSRSLIGKHAQIQQEMRNTVIGAFMTGIRSEQPSFLNALLDSTKFTKEIEKNLGATINQITTGAFKKMTFSFPKQDEQTKIGNYFQQLDKLIEQKEKKYQKLKQFKKAMLDKMFPKNRDDTPEIRFKGFSGKWEEKFLLDTITYTKGFAFKSIDYRNQGTRIIRVSDLTEDNISDTTQKIYIDKIKTKQFDNYILNMGDIIITTVGSKAELKDSAVGRAIIVRKNESYLLNQNLVKITPTPKFESYFIHTLFLSKKYSKYIENIQRGNANQANIALGDLWNYKFQCPILEEQKKIGNYFQKLDNQIDLQQKELEKLKNIKKASLNKMFV